MKSAFWSRSKPGNRWRTISRKSLRYRGSTACSSARRTCRRHIGLIGQPGHPDVQEAIKKAAATIRKCGKAPGILTTNEEEAKRYIEWGYLFVAVGVDTSLLVRAADGLAKRFKA